MIISQLTITGCISPSAGPVSGGPKSGRRSVQGHSQVIREGHSWAWKWVTKHFSWFLALRAPPPRNPLFQENRMLCHPGWTPGPTAWPQVLQPQPLTRVFCPHESQIQTMSGWSGNSPRALLLPDSPQSRRIPDSSDGSQPHRYLSIPIPYPDQCTGRPEAARAGVTSSLGIRWLGLQGSQRRGPLYGHRWLPG